MEEVRYDCMDCDWITTGSEDDERVLRDVEDHERWRDHIVEQRDI